MTKTMPWTLKRLDTERDDMLFQGAYGTSSTSCLGFLFMVARNASMFIY